MGIGGLHHVTAVSADAQRNLDFYAGVLGLRFVKRTVNFDDPRTYHLYYGDRLGSPGSAMTFFPFEGIPRGRDGTGHTSITQFAVPEGSLAFWEDRLARLAVSFSSPETVLGERRLLLEDRDGMALALVETDDPREPWTTEEIGAEVALRGFHAVTLTMSDHRATAALLERHLGYRPIASEGPVRRYGSAAPGFVDIQERPDLPRMRPGAGRVHHIAFLAENDEVQLSVRAALAADGHQVTPQVDRSYFRSIYFGSPGGVLFEVATAGPGFAIDEDEGELGTGLKLPPQHEHLRPELERSLSRLVLP